MKNKKSIIIPLSSDDFPIFQISKNLPTSSLVINKSLGMLEQLKVIREKEALSFLTFYLNFGYYSLLIPYRISFNNLTGAHEFIFSSTQKTLRILCASIATVYFLLKIRGLYSQKHVDPSYFFDIANYFFDTIFLIPLYIIFGWKSSEILPVIYEEIQNSDFSQGSGSKFIPSKMAKMISAFFTTLVVIHPIFFLFGVFVNHGNELGGTYKYFRNDGLMYIGSIFGISEKNTIQNDSIYSFLTPSLAFLSFFTMIIDKIINSYADIMFTIILLVFRELGNQFTKTLSSRRKAPAFQVLEHYRWLRVEVEKINKATGIITFGFIIGNLPFFATSIFNIFTDGNNFDRSVNVVVCIYFFTSLFFAAKYSNEISKIKEWLWEERNYSRLPKENLGVFMQEVTNSSIALNAFGCLSVNYATFGSIVSIIFTYALLKQQFLSQPQPH